MHYDISLANRVRAAIVGRRGIVEKEIGDGLTFLLHGRMCCGVAGDRLMVRVEPDHFEEALLEPGVSPPDYTGKTAKDHVLISLAALGTEEAIRMWVGRGVQCASQLAPVRTTPVATRPSAGLRRKR